MKIAVCAKYVPEATAARRIDPSTKRLDRSGEGVLNPFDANAVEEALKLRDATGEGEVVIVSLGPEKALEAMRRALAMGADRVVLVSDEAAAGSDLVATARVLASALEREEADLVLFGQQANDGDGAVLWAAVADRLQRPLISQVAELSHEDGKVRGKRQTEFGYDVIEAPLPAVVAVSDAINVPRYPALKGIMGAKKKPQETLSLADLGVPAEEAGEAGSRTTVVALNDPPARGDLVKLEDDGSAAEKIVEFLAGEAGAMKFLVFLEHHEGKLQKDALGVLGKAASLGEAEARAARLRRGRARRRRRPLRRPAGARDGRRPARQAAAPAAGRRARDLARRERLRRRPVRRERALR